MFNSPKPTADKLKPKSVPRDGAVTILTNGCHFSGKLYCRGASRIGGKIEGQIVSEGLLIIEEEAVINAEIKADEAIIQGRITGKLTATGRVELCATSKVEGDIHTPVLIVREGAQFNGRSTVMEVTAAKDVKAPKILSGGKNAKDGRGPDIGENVKNPDVAAFKIPEVNV